MAGALTVDMHGTGMYNGRVQQTFVSSKYRYMKKGDGSVKNALVKPLCLLLVLLVMVVCSGTALAALKSYTAVDYGTEGFTIDKLSTRSGPSTEYRETDTYKVKGEWIRVLSFSYDDGGVCWLQCDIPYGNKLRRVYTGLKRFDASTVNLDILYEEDPLTFVKVKVLETSKALYGPGEGYDVYKSLTVDRRQTVSLLATEGDYAQVEWTTTKQSYRAWVPLSTLDDVPLAN